MDAKVSALTTDGAGNVYAGGIFTTAGGVAVNNIAKWNGTTWAALGNGANGQVLDLHYANNKLYTAGLFTKVGSDIRSQGIAYYDGTNWNAMAQGVDNSSITPSVYGVTTDADGNVYIAGYFDIRYSDDAPINHAAMYDGTDWQPLGNGIGQSTTQGANALFADGNNIYAGGAFMKPTGGLQNTAIWNKTVDFTVDVAPSVQIYSFENTTCANNPLYVVAEFSETVTGFAIADVTVTNGNVTGMTELVAGLKYNLQITPTQVGTITVNIAAAKVTDQTGNPNTAAAEFTILYDNTTGVASVSENKIAVYPNPCSTMLNIKTMNENSKFDIRVLNLQGVTVMQTKADASGSLNVQNLSNGIYILELTSEGNVTRTKFVKSN